MIIFAFWHNVSNRRNITSREQLQHWFNYVHRRTFLLQLVIVDDLELVQVEEDTVDGLSDGPEQVHAGRQLPVGLILQRNHHLDLRLVVNTAPLNM